MHLTTTITLFLINFILINIFTRCHIPMCYKLFKYHVSKCSSLFPINSHLVCDSRACTWQIVEWGLDSLQVTLQLPRLMTTHSTTYLMAESNSNIEWWPKSQRMSSLAYSFYELCWGLYRKKSKRSLEPW